MKLPELHTDNIPIKISLKYKFAVFTSLLILFVCVFLSWFLMAEVEKELRRQIHLRGESTIINFSQNAKYSITTQNKAFIRTLVEREIAKEDVVHVVIINEKGIVIGHNNPTLVGTQVQDEYTQTLLETLEKPTMRKITIPTGEPVYDFVTPILDSDVYTSDRYANLWEVRQRLPDTKNLGIIRIGLSFQKMEESLKQTYRWVFYISLGIALFTIILSFIYGKVVIKPLTEMTRIASRLASGYLDERVEIVGNDEISLLASNFNTMAKSLQESSSNLWKLNKDLEYKVEERTAELKKAYEDLQQIDQLKSAFLSTVSHELRTPLTSILGFSKMIRKQFVRNIVPNLSEEAEKAAKASEVILQNLDIITTESNRLARLINDVLDLAKIESGKMQWKKESIKLDELFKRALQSCQSLIENKPLQLEISCEEEIPEIFGDADRIFQVIMNLLSNAVKFSREGRIICSLKTRDGFVQAAVKDSGIGIAEKDLLGVFEKFQQVGDTLTDKPQGTGLGLPICREIIEYHKGQIWADSKPGKGSTFYFALPVSEDKPVPVTVKEVTLRLEDKIERMERAEYLILLVDDDPDVRNLLQITLEDEGYRTIQAINGKEACDLAREYPVNAVIIDIMMYELDGFNTPQQLKIDPKTKDIPIMLLSIIPGEDNEIEMGATTYLTSPISAEKILNRTSEILRLYSRPLLGSHIFFLGFSKHQKKIYQMELKQMGVKFEHFDSFPALKKALDSEADAVVFVDFSNTQIPPNALFKAIRHNPATKNTAIIPVIHVDEIAISIDENPVPVRTEIFLSNIVDSINDIFGRRPRTHL
jgi:signal transduction histidine kinase/CheY-like chemotaxis protein